MKKILCTCPPMIQLIERYKDRFFELGMEVTCPVFEQELTEAELLNLVPNFDGWIVGDDPANELVLTTGVQGSLKAAVRWGIGTDNVDFEAAKKLGLNISNTPSSFNEEVSDVAIAYLIGLARELFLIDRSVRKGNWKKPVGQTLTGKNVGLIGFGNIGKATARKLECLGLKITVYDPGVESVPSSMSHSSWPIDLEMQDYLVFTCSLNAHNYRMLGADTMSRLKEGVRIVNVGRGALIDEAALVDGLEAGLVHSAALDVFDSEPIAISSPLMGFERCIFGSHNSSNTLEAVDRVSLKCIDIISKELS